MYSKYTSVVTLKHQTGITIFSNFQKTLEKSNRKPSKIQVDKGSEVQNRTMKSWVQDNYVVMQKCGNDVEMYSKHNEREFIVVEIFIRTLKSKIYKPKQVLIDKLDDKINEQNNTYHSTIKMKPIDVKCITYIDFSVENNEKDLKFEAVDHVKI